VSIKKIKNNELVFTSHVGPIGWYPSRRCCGNGTLIMIINVVD